MKRAHLLVLTVLSMLALTGTAYAANADEVAKALRSSPVYQAPDVNLVDVGTVKSELEGSDPPVYLALLPASAAKTSGDAHNRATEIGKALGKNDAVVLVITKNQHLGAAEGNGAASRGVQAGAALKEQLANIGDAAFDKNHIAALVTQFTQTVEKQASSGGSTTTGSNGSSSSSGSSGHGGAYLLGALALLGGGGAAIAVASSRRRKARLNEGLRADVEQLYTRLGSDVSLLDAGDDPVAKQAMADASERYNACGAVLATADAPAEFAAARRTAVEGLTAARTARIKLGLDPGPEIPPPPGSGPQ